MKTTALIGAAAAVAFLGLAGPAGAQDFDGKWSVRLTTISGSCDASLSTTVGVSGGRIADAGMFLSTHGSVDNSGHLAIRAAGGGYTLAASGKLAAQGGSGTWTSPSHQCSGRWVASRS